jgi:hypothetical protein
MAADQEPLTIEQIPQIPGYLSVAQAAEIFGYAKESIFYKIYRQRAFNHVYRVGDTSPGSRPVLVLLEAEVREVKAREDAASTEEPFKSRLRSWNRRVKQWGVDNNWTQNVIHKSGQPHIDLQAAYEKAHPDDLRPTE